jgi:hypothetical protein
MNLFTHWFPAVFAALYTGMSTWLGHKGAKREGFRDGWIAGHRDGVRLATKVFCQSGNLPDEAAQQFLLKVDQFHNEMLKGES